MNGFEEPENISAARSMQFKIFEAISKKSCQIDARWLANRWFPKRGMILCFVSANSRYCGFAWWLRFLHCTQQWELNSVSSNTVSNPNYGFIFHLLPCTAQFRINFGLISSKNKKCSYIGDTSCRDNFLDSWYSMPYFPNKLTFSSFSSYAWSCKFKDSLIQIEIERRMMPKNRKKKYFKQCVPQKKKWW